jgi:hypothetical protein
LQRRHDPQVKKGKKNGEMGKSTRKKVKRRKEIGWPWSTVCSMLASRSY